MSKIVFLDIDGVLNHRDWFAELARTGKLSIESVDPECVKRLSRLCEITGSKVVISSSWRSIMSLDRVSSFLARYGFTGEIIGATPELYDTDSCRGDEITKWLHEETDPSDRVMFVILDDDADMGSVADRLVQTSFDTGLQDEHVAKAIALLDS
jgi:hypothetical protein